MGVSLRDSSGNVRDVGSLLDEDGDYFLVERGGENHSGAQCAAR